MHEIMLVDPCESQSCARNFGCVKGIVLINRFSMVHRDCSIMLDICVLGLRVDDLLDEDIPEVAEAVSRLDDEIQYQRLFRIKRAMDLSLKHNILPKEQWTKPEEVCSNYFPVFVNIIIIMSSFLRSLCPFLPTALLLHLAYHCIENLVFVCVGLLSSFSFFGGA